MGPHNAHMLCWSTLVEVNTLCLVLKKLTKWNVFQTLFIGSWFSLRLGWYPFIVWYYHHEMIRQGYPYMGYEHLQVVLGHAAITGLNFFWTVEFIQGMMKPKSKKKQSD